MTELNIVSDTNPCEKPAKLLFRYGAMGSSKTANALMVKYNYEEKGKKVVMLKPLCESRDGEKVVRSRIGLQTECEYVETFLERYNNEHYDAIIVDEVQFLKPDLIDRLGDLADINGITIICYGLRTDFQGNLFPGSKRLMEISDDIEQIKTICWCGRRAQFNARILNGKMVTEGEQMQLGGNDSYTSLCRKHYKLRQLAAQC